MVGALDESGFSGKSLYFLDKTGTRPEVYMTVIKSLLTKVWVNLADFLIQRVRDLLVFTKEKPSFL